MTGVRDPLASRLAWASTSRVRRGAGLAAATVRRRALTTVVVDTAAADPGAVDAVLHRLRGHPTGALRVVLVGTGERPAATEVSARHAREDWRVRTSRGTLTVGAPGEALVLRPGAPTGPDTLARLTQAGLGDVALELAVSSVAGGEGTRFGQVDDPRPDLPAWLAGVRTGRAVLDASPDLLAPWCLAVLRGETARFLVAVERLDEPAWTDLAQRLADLTGPLAPVDWAELPWLTRTLAWLGSRGRRTDLEALVLRTRLEEGQVSIDVMDGVVLAEERHRLPADVPPWCVQLHPDETPLHVSLRRLRWRPDDVVEAELYVRISRVGSDGSTVVGVELADDAGARLAVGSWTGTDRAVDRWARERYADHAHGLLHVSVDARSLAEAGPGTSRLLVRVATGPVVRVGPVDEVDRTGSVGSFRPRTVAGQVVEAVADRDLGLRFLVHGPEDEPVPGTVEGPVLRDARAPEVVTVRAAVGSVTVLLRWPGVEPEGTTYALVGGDGTKVDGRADGPPGDREVVFDTHVDAWGRGPAPVPAGTYRLVVEHGTWTGSPPAADSLADELPVDLTTEDHRLRLRGTRTGELRLVLAAPLRGDELGPRAQQLLQDAYRADAEPTDPGVVYLQAYAGGPATDSPLAIHHELRRRRPDLRLVWAIADRSCWVPDGAETVLWRSRAWHHVLARAALVVTNIELEPFFVPRADQTVLQTFHGYPSKSMGIGLWRDKGFTESRIEQQLDRTSRTWDVLLTPSPEMDAHYRREYRYDGEVLAAGYPRDDALVTGDVGGTRRRTREGLGVAPDQVLVLYAPTWRDDLATNFRSARAADHLDADAAAGALGAGHVLALRGHRFHTREGQTRRAAQDAARVVDVTAYPEINDLVLACDVAVLDYSSLRFDIAVAGRPMVFLVPDLEDYTGTTRGFLYDFRPSAPGPLVSSTAEVVEALGDLDGLRATYAADLARFTERFHRLQDGHAAERVVDRLLG